MFYLYGCLCTTWLPGAHRDKKKAMDSLERELRVGCRNQTWVFCKSTQCLETLSYFSSPKNLFLFLLYLEALVPTNVLVIFVFVHLSPIYLFSHSTTLVDKTSNVHKLIYLPPYPSPSVSHPFLPFSQILCGSYILVGEEKTNSSNTTQIQYFTKY